MTSAAGSVPRDLGDEAPGLQLLRFITGSGVAIVVGGLLGGIAGIGLGLTSTRTYSSDATFFPQASSQQSSAGLALAASELGIRVPAGDGWGPPVYVELLKSKTLLSELATDTFTVAEEGGRRVILMDLLRATALTEPERVDRAVVLLSGMVSAMEDRPSSTVALKSTTRWPSVSFAIVDRLLNEVNRFNVESRQSQAASERKFIEGRLANAEHELRGAEDQYQEFLEHNREFATPALTLARGRIERDVATKQQLYSALLQSLEEARAREVRDTPVITIIETPRTPTLPNSRRTLLKGAVGALGGGLGALIYTFLRAGYRQAREAQIDEADRQAGAGLEYDA